MRKTTNYGLTLYDKEDKMIITAEENSLNATMEIIDKELKTIEDEKATIEDMTNYIEEHKDELKGADGKDGINGQDGYTPIKGVDYFDGQDYVLTETDKEDISKLVEVNIPTKVSQLENDENYLSSVPLEYVTETELSEKGYATESFVSNKIAEAELSGSDVDLSGLATKDELNAKVDKVKGKSLIDDTEITRLASVDNYDDTELKNTVNSKADKTELHSHSNKSVLDNTTASYTTAEKTKLAGLSNYDDTEIKAQINTKTSATDVENIIKLDGVPSELLPYAKEGAKSINEALTEAGCNKSSFLFYSDVHYTSGSGMSPYFLKYLYKNTGINKTIFGGDIVDNEGSDYNTMEYLWEWREKIKDLPNHHSVAGNHDDGNSTDRLFDENYVYGYLLAPEETPDIVRGTSGLYYYIDNPTEKTRYLYLDTGYLDAYSLSTAQSNFIKETLKSTQSGWHIVVVSHIWFMPDYDQYSVRPIPISGLSTPAKAVCTILNNYNERAEEFASCGAKIEFCIGGHVHRDFVGTTKYDTTNDGIPIILVETDSRHLRSEHTYKTNDITDLSVNGIIANYNTNMLHVVRVGRGSGFVVDLTNPTLVTRYSIVNDLTNVSSSSSETQVTEGLFSAEFSTVSEKNGISTKGQYIGPYPPSGTHTYTVYVFAGNHDDSRSGHADSHVRHLQESGHV